MIKKTPLELKQERLIKRWKQKQKGSKKTKKPKVKIVYPNADHLRGKSYAVFLASAYWKIVRGVVLKRDRHQCRICKSRVFLQVHHTTYKNHFKEHKHLEDLMTLCRKCHREHHYAEK